VMHPDCPGCDPVGLVGDNGLCRGCGHWKQGTVATGQELRAARRRREMKLDLIHDESV
jgi:hypothetical protein